MFLPQSLSSSCRGCIQAKVCSQTDATFGEWGQYPKISPGYLSHFEFFLYTFRPRDDMLNYSWVQR